MNATYIISIARKLGCSIFLLPEDIIEVFLVSPTRAQFTFSTFPYSYILIYLNKLGESKDDADIDSKYYVLDLETTTC